MVLKNDIEISGLPYGKKRKQNLYFILYNPTKGTNKNINPLKDWKNSYLHIDKHFFNFIKY